MTQRYSLKFIQIYAPTSAHSDFEVEAKYEDISRARHSSKTHYTVVMGDFNAKLSQRDGDVQFGVGCRNHRSHLLAGIMEKERFYMMNSLFNKREHRNLPWKFEPVSVDTKTYGKFYNGDAYIVLKTTGQASSTLSYNAHFWLGSKSTQDKQGTAAILTTTLDDMLGGRAVHYREVQDHESGLFLEYFQPAIRYLEGGNESGFTEIETNAGAEKRLLKLSGCEHMRIEEVPADPSSLTRENCFILEVDHDIFVLMPEGAKATQRRKIISVANSLRDDYHNGRAVIEIIDEFSSDDDISAFFEALGSGSKDDLKDDETTQNYARESPTAVYLYRVLVGDDIDLVALDKPYKQKQLASDEIYILDTPGSGVYIWLGQNVDADTKKKYNQIVQQYLDVKGYPNWINVTRVAEGAECSTFKQYFNTWDTVIDASYVLSSNDAGYFSEEGEEPATAFQVGKSAAARGYMPDQGDGNLKVIRISGGEEDVTERFSSGVSVMYQSEVYVVVYKYTNDFGEEAQVAHLWSGLDSRSDDKKPALDMILEIEDSEPNTTIVIVPQNKEPKHLLKIFKGNLVILLGGHETGYQPTNGKGTYDEDNVRLFRVEGTELGADMRVVQSPENADVLEDDDVFVLETSDTVYVRNGQESSEIEREAALSFVTSVVSDKQVTVVSQGDEPDAFWEALGGQPSEKEVTAGWKAIVSRRVTTPYNLTAVSVSVTGKVKMEELDTFSQQDLSEDGIFILDGGEELYLWQGDNIPERVKQARFNIIEEYIKEDDLDRTVETSLVVGVKQGREPRVFKSKFTEWDPDMWSNLTSYEDLKNEVKATNSK